MKKSSIVLAAAATLGLASAAGAGTLDDIKARGHLLCGVSTGLAGFSNPDSAGKWSGLDVDVCKAIAAAILGDAEKVKFVPATAQQRFTMLQSKEVDLLSRNTTWTLQRDTALGLNFAPTTYYDGQGFMVPKALNVKTAKDLAGATVCVQPGTTTELNLADYFRAQKMDFKPVVIEKLEEVNAAYFAGRCDVLTTDASGLASVRATVAQKPDDHIILPEIISKEPLAPAVRHGDDAFFDVVKWTVYALLEAEEKGISSKNVDQMATSQDPTIQRLLGTSPGMGKALGVDEKWAFNAIKQVGNYAEIFDRNVGPSTPLRLERGLNALWTKPGGLMYAPPIR